MISRSCAAALMAIICSVLTGCFYDHPLTDTPSKDINTWLLGVWEHTNDKGDLDRATVLPLTGARYTVWYESEPKSGPKKQWRFEGWISRVGSAVFLTLRCDEGPGDIPQGSYVFLHYQLLNQNRIAIRQPQLDAAPDASSYQLRTDLRRKLKEKTLFKAEPAAIWKRVSEVYWDPNSQEPQPFQPLRFPESGLQ
jgi:hypothetical protein